MATVRKFEHTQTKTGARSHTEVDATIGIVESNGETFIQIDTFGSVDREYPGKLSQTLRLSKKAYQELVDMGKFLS
ncbi:hypothetical protein [Qipengyuania profunda]|jgi:hypothetical protein|uniref:hypothetical protein n=1 Tax=Qipengyuania profunda TaxID=3113984 RepID=UPI002A1890CC|nr:hypothetical protein [Qipengyuania sp. HL-TH1]WPL56042.1 hypothetical protein SD421_11240 [Qipengyuania sp. HL-TH5]